MTLRNFLKEFNMNQNVWIISLLIAVLALIGSIGFYHYSALNSMERNIDSAIAKGIDPLAVRCAYNSSNSSICIAYAMSNKK